ncbi:hypothetical protein pb186bvf_003165 [Paramecium bursaria]
MIHIVPFIQETNPYIQENKVNKEYQCLNKQFKILIILILPHLILYSSAHIYLNISSNSLFNSLTLHMILFEKIHFMIYNIFVYIFQQLEINFHHNTITHQVSVRIQLYLQVQAKFKNLYQSKMKWLLIELLLMIQQKKKQVNKQHVFLDKFQSNHNNVVILFKYKKNLPHFSCLLKQKSIYPSFNCNYSLSLPVFKDQQNIDFHGKQNIINSFQIISKYITQSTSYIF